MAAQVNVSDHCLLSIVLERGKEEIEDERFSIAEMLAAADALTSGWLVPLGVGLSYVQCDPTNYFEEKGRPARAAHFVRRASVPPEVRLRPPFSTGDGEAVTEIDAATIQNTVLQGLDQPAPPGLVNCLSQLWWTAVRARSPINDTIELRTPDPASPVTEVIDGSLWHFGPKAGSVVGAPAWLRCSNSYLATELLLEVYWDLWRDYAPGRAMIDAGVARVLARPGWTAQQVYPKL